MNDNPRANGSRGRDPYAALRLIALIAAIAGVIVLAAAAFVLSYGGIHKIALSAGVSPNVARIFPVIFDAMLVVSCAAVVSLRSAGWWQRTYAWLSTLALLVVVAAADAAQATGTHIPRKPAAATVAILPWALLLLAFSLLLSMLRHFRRTRAAMAGVAVTDGGAAETAAAIASRPGLDILDSRGPDQQPAVAGTITQRDAVLPARMVPVSVPVQEGTPSVPVQESAPSVPVQESPPPLTRPAETLQAATPPTGLGEAATVVASAEPALNGTAPPKSADPEPAGQERADQELAGEEQAVQEQVALEEAGEEEAPGGGQAEPAPEAGARPAEAQPADTRPAAAQPAEAQPADTQPAEAQPAEAQITEAQTADSQSSAAQPAEAEAPQAESHAEEPDTGPSDTGSPDTGSPDTGSSDTGLSDTGLSDTGQPGPDEQPQSQAPPPGKSDAEPAGAQQAGAPGGGTIHVPHQAMPAPVPAPSPHFDRLRSTPTPPEDEPDSDS